MAVMLHGMSDFHHVLPILGICVACYSVYQLVRGPILRSIVPGRVILGMLAVGVACLFGYQQFSAHLQVVHPVVVIVWFYANVIMIYGLVVMMIGNARRGWPW